MRSRRHLRAKGPRWCSPISASGKKVSIDELAPDLNVALIHPCDVTKDEELTGLTSALAALKRPLHAVVHSLAFANREDLARPFVETSRAGFLLAQDVSAYSLVALARAVMPAMTEGGSISTLTYLGSQRVVPNYNVMGVARPRWKLPCDIWRANWASATFA